MGTDKRFDEAIGAWFEETAPQRLPERVLEATFERTRKSRQRVGWRALLDRVTMTVPVPALGGVAVVVVAASLALTVAPLLSGLGGPPPDPGPRSAFLGTWATADLDGSRPTMTITTSGDDALEIVVLDDFASVCSGAPSTMTGTGRLEGSTRLVIAAPVYTCDDGSEPEALSGPPLSEQLRDLTFDHDPEMDTLIDNFDSVWRRVGAESPSPGSPSPDSPSPEPTTSFSDVEVTELLNGFADARVAGDGAQQYLSVPEADVPLLYTTTSGAPYERAEFERVAGIEWPYGLTAFMVRLFAGSTVVEQLVFTPGDGRPAVEYAPDGFGTHIAPTTEDGQPVARLYRNSLDGEVTLRVTHPWVFRSDSTNIQLIPEGTGVLPTTDGGERNDWDSVRLMADPVLFGADCQTGPSPADARALAESIRSDPDLGATAPVVVSAGGAEAVIVDVKIAAGAPVCEASAGGGSPRIAVLSPVFDVTGSSVVYPDGLESGEATGEWMRLYLFDMPAGSSARILAIAIVAPESRFERVVEAARPVVESVEFHAP